MGAGKEQNRGIRIANGGYITVLMPEHPKADSAGYVREHVLICEKALGKPLPVGAEPHHVNRVTTDNSPRNLVVCQDHAYHMLLHHRTRALKACGHASWRKCQYCKRYDDPAKMYVNPAARSAYHRECSNLFRRERRGTRKLYIYNPEEAYPILRMYLSGYGCSSIAVALGVSIFPVWKLLRNLTTMRRPGPTGPR